MTNKISGTQKIDNRLPFLWNKSSIISKYSLQKRRPETKQDLKSHKLNYSNRKFSIFCETHFNKIIE